MFEEFLVLHGEADILKGIKLEYDSRSCHIIMSPPPTPYHDCTPFFLQSTLFSLRDTPFDTPARQRSLVVREIAFRTRGGSFMVPDSAVVVMPLDGEPRLWPTIVVEVANSQDYGDVLAKVKRWFRNSHGMVEVALILKFTAKDPILDPACFLEVWRYEARVSDEVDDQSPVINAEGDEYERTGDPDSGSTDGNENGNTSTTGCPSSDRSSSSEGQESQAPEDHLIDAVSLDTDCILPSSDGEHQPNIPTVDADISNPHDMDSDSSLSSLDDAEIDIPASQPDQDTASASSQSSSASTSEYRPIPPRHRRQIYLSGPRKTILPVADPVDQEIQYLTLFYSDFFGSENVPDGRGPNEEVQLDLDELRLEIRLLVKMTEKQANVNKHPAAGNGRGGRRVKR